MPVKFNVNNLCTRMWLHFLSFTKWW